MGLTKLTEQQQKEFQRLSRIYWREARKCESAKAYLAGCVMIGSYLETLLITMMDCYSEEADGTGKAPKDTKPLTRWTLEELLTVAMAAGWLPENKFGPHVEFARKIRNFVHPGRYGMEHPRGRITHKWFETQFEIASACRGWLAHHNNESLFKLMKDDGLL